MKKTVFKMFMISNLIILAFAIFIAFFAFYTYQMDMRSQSEKYNLAFLSQVQNTFDEQIKDIHSLLDNVYMDPSVRSLLFSKADQDIYERYTTAEVMNKLKNLVSIYNNVDSVVLVYNDERLIITNSSVYRSRNEFFEQSDYSYRSLENWETLFNDTQFMKYAGTVECNGKALYTIIKPILLGPRSFPSGYVIVNFYYDQLKENLLNFVNVEKGVIYISDHENNIIMSIGNISLKDSVEDGINSVKNPTLKYSKVNKEYYMIYSLYSGSTRLKYVFMLPESSFLGNEINLLLLLTFISVIVIGFVFCILSAKYNANPILKITEMIAQKNIIPFDERETNEIALINNATAKAMNEYANIKNEYTKQIPILQSNLIYNILKGVLVINKSGNDELRALGIDFEYKKYSVIIFDYQGPGDGANNGCYYSHSLRVSIFAKIFC